MSNPIEISDLVGLKEPITKLIEVISKGIGTLYEPSKIRKLADAKAYEIKKINTALKEHGVSGEIEYDGNQIKLTTSLVNGEISQSLVERMLYKEMKMQSNTDNIISIAYKELSKEESVSGQEVDEDWISRFFRISEDISSEEMQLLWGKILAGEIINPNTYSLRTLEILRNLNKREAELFTKISSLAFKSNTASFIIGDKKYLEDEFGIKLSDILLLDELNLINSQELAYILMNNNEQVINEFFYANKVIRILKDISPDYRFQIYKLTKCGEELLNLVEQEFNESNVKKFASMIKNAHIKVSYHDIVKIEGGQYWYSKVGIEL